MILIRSKTKAGIEVRLPGDKARGIKPCKVFYLAAENGFIFRSPEGIKTITCKKYMTRVIILFDIMIIKAKQYNHNVEHIICDGKPLATTNFPVMGIELSKEEFEKEREILHDVRSGALLTDPFKNEDLGVLMDLFVAGGIK